MMHFHSVYILLLLTNIFCCVFQCVLAHLSRDGTPDTKNNTLSQRDPCLLWISNIKNINLILIGDLCFALNANSESVKRNKSHDAGVHELYVRRVGPFHLQSQCVAV